MKIINKLLKGSIQFRILILAILTSTGACDGDNYQELSGNYILRDEGANNKSILSKEKGRPNIYSKVVDWEYNSDFILVKQEPIYEDYVTMIGYELRISNYKKYSTNSSGEQKESEVEADSMLKNNPYLRSIFNNKINYWIISNKVKKLYGPFTRSAYRRMRSRLGVPDGFDLKEE